MPFRRLLLFLLPLIFVSLLAAPLSLAAQGEFVPTFEPGPCPFEGTELVWIEIAPEDTGFECGTVSVPERHDASDGTQIQLPVAILRATGPNAQPDPLIVMQGGPGGSVFSAYALVAPGSAILQERDLVLVNQRGTQFTEPELLCTEFFDSTVAMLEEDDMDSAEIESMALLQACRDRLADQNIDLSAYNSLENAADIADVAEALGYEAYNFFGVSYGTLLGFHLMRNHPDNLRSVILDGVVPPNLNFIPQVGESESRVYQTLFDACEADDVCSAEYPDLRARTFALFDTLNESPVRVTLTDSETGDTANAYLDGEGLRSLFFQIFYIGDAYAFFPRLVAQIEAGDFDQLAFLWEQFAFDRSMSTGMYYSVICAEDADFVPEEVELTGVLPELEDAGMVDDLQYYLDACAVWDVETLPPTVDDPVTSDIPTLLLSGQFDPITPPSNADLAATARSNAMHVVDTTGSHGVAFLDPCIDQITSNFLNDPQSEPDTACLAELERADVVLASALTLPIVSDVGALDADYFNGVALAGVLLFGLTSALFVWVLLWLIRRVRKRSLPLTQSQIRLRRWGQLLVLAFVIVATIFVAGLGRVLYDAVFVNTPSIYVNAVDSGAAFVFVLPWILIALAVGIAIVTIKMWRQPDWPLVSKLGFTFLTICAIGYVSILTYHGTTTVLLS